MTIGETIFKYRKQAGLSQEELAYKMDVTRQSVSLWETDQTTPSLESLKMLSEIFGVSLDELCGTSAKEGEPTQPDPTANDAESAQFRTPESEKVEYLACAQTRYTPELLKHLSRVTTKRFYVIGIIGIVAALAIGLGILFSDANNVYAPFSIIFIAVIVGSIIRVSLTVKKRTQEFFRLRPNCVVKVDLYQDYFDVQVTSDNTNSKATVRYSDVKKVRNDEKCILIYYGNTIVPIEKDQPDTNYELILKLLNVPQTNNRIKPKNKAIRALLLIMFILSLLSIFMAFIAVAVSMALSPLPEFPYDMPEHMWVFFLFIPLPLASTVLGIVFCTKKYRCKKNIIAGVIMCVLLALYGSFTFALRDPSIHDFGYVRELEQTVSMSLPDSGYIWRADRPDHASSSIAMIRFDDADEIYNIVSSDGRFRTDTDFMPLNYINISYVALASDYDYFMLYDVTSGQVNAVPESGTEEHRLIFIAYHIDKNILFVLDFMK